MAATAAIDIALGSVERIIKIAAEIKQAVETAKRNREEVVDILERVETVEQIVLVLDETDVTTNQSMDRALENLHRALHRALELVRDCGKKNKVCLLCAAQDLSKQLLRVQDDISHKLMQVTLAITVHITIELGKKADAPRTRRRGRRRRRPVGPRWHRPHDKLRHAATAVLATERMVRSANRTTWPEDKDALPDFGEWNVEDLEDSDFENLSYRIINQGRKADFKSDSDGAYKADLKSDSDGYPCTPPKHGKVLEVSLATLSGLKIFSLSELNAATNNFSDDRVIGEGNNSTVYKGVLPDGHVVALKVLLDSHFEDSQTRLLDEVNIGAKLKHKNVVRHLGYCMDIKTDLVEKRTHVLVLDYLPNGSLGEVVRGDKLVEWSSCFRIIQEIAQGIHYLHEQRVIHGDLKPDNILFDTHMNPVIIDFGKSIILDPDIDEEILDHPVGALGYMAPETYESRCLSLKSDVFAFGVCLVRTVIFLSTGRRDWYDAQDWKKTFQKAGEMKGLLLPKLQINNSQLMDINRYLEVGWLCTEMDPAKRPTMADVVQMLSGEKEPPVPKNRRSKGRWP